MLRIVEANTACSSTFIPQKELFRGTIQANRFAIWRLSMFTNWATRPQVTGWIEPNPYGSGTMLLLRQRASLIAFGFGNISSFLMAMGVSALLWEPMLDGKLHLLQLLLPFLFPLCIILFTLLPFRLAAAENRRILTRLLFLQQVVES
ncbi:hypothetical protein MUN84_02780 [Hymenobacter sp. 5516J-16]|uniref:hypothetical protein n=1 Tax=Hymenobacter sp. 5516J-16 TaxID=2932253 RepID=UPI001FD29A87|nr:hypothetical protein [Hymenobacter sp. 5516J-16]UOQ77628.1 hypothetical protein MUN84_02780 [Hymenobacter sp. 5516J-16]